MAAAGEGPKFAILDVVFSLLPGEEGERGVVYQVQRYEEGSYRYAVDCIDADSPAIGGIYAQSDLTPTDETASLEHFWRGKIRVREVVRIAETHPKPQRRGRYAEVAEEITPDARYAVYISTPRKRRIGVKTRYKYVSARHLERTGERMPPEPVPRPSTTWTHDGDDSSNLRPWCEYYILDEIEQYL